VIIDIHTHFFPDEMAEKTIRHLEGLAGVKAYGNGDLLSLRQYMKEDGVDLSVNVPAATKPQQVIGINRRMVEFNRAGNKDVICFGAMHPYFNTIGNFEDEIKYLYDNGIKGIKMHPEYQQFYPDDGRVKKVYKTCAELGMIILFHAGADSAFDEDDVKGTPQRFAAVAEAYPNLKMILAHMGGYRLWDDAYRYLAGKNVFFDTAFCDEMDDTAFTNIIKDHGADKILFGSDFPWERPAKIISKIEKCFPQGDIKEKIYHTNAERLLGIKI